MASEILKVFDENMNQIGQKTRDEIHAEGDWHETFECWFTLKEDDQCYVLLQKRAEMKKDYPGLLDITSAGHLLAEETVEDGVREVEEELGVSVAFDDLIQLGILKEELKTEQIWDREFCHVFLYKCRALPDFHLQIEEVDSLYKAKLDDLLGLFEGRVSEIEVVEIGDCLQKTIVGTGDFVGNKSYYVEVFERFQERRRPCHTKSKTNL